MAVVELDPLGANGEGNFLPDDLLGEVHVAITTYDELSMEGRPVSEVRVVTADGEQHLRLGTLMLLHGLEDL